MKFISNISEKTGLQENMILGILLIFSSVVLYFIYKKMNNKKENFGVTQQVCNCSDDTDFKSFIDTNLKGYCRPFNANGQRCKDAYSTGNGFDACENCFKNCESAHSGENKQIKWCKIGCNRKFNSYNADDVCPQKIQDVSVSSFD